MRNNTPTSICSNNTNKLSPQELDEFIPEKAGCSNNTNKLSPQELSLALKVTLKVQIIQINLVLKNIINNIFNRFWVQIIQINLVLKNR